MLSVADDHSNTWLRLSPKRTDGQGDLQVLVCQQPLEAIYELLYGYPNVGDYKGRTWLLLMVTNSHFLHQHFTQKQDKVR